MKVSQLATCLAACLAPLTVLAAPTSDNQKVITNDDDHKIPGESPLELCPGDHEDDLVTIDSVDLSPNPPKAGQKLTIKATGTVKKPIESESYVLLTVKYGVIKLLTTTVDLCEQVSNVDLSCPLEEGKLTVVKEVDIPAEVPPGKYNVVADVYTKDNESITCLTASVAFPRSGFASFFNNEL